MAKFTDVEIIINDKGERIVRYTRTNEKGESIQLEQPYFDENGHENPEVQDILIKAKKQEVLEKANKKNLEVDKIITKPKEELKQIEDKSMNLETNPKFNEIWFKKHIGKVAKYGIIAVIGILAGLNLPSCKAKDLVSTAVEQNTETKDDDVKSKVEGAVEYISYDEAINDMAIIGDKWQDMGYDDVSQRSLNSLYFATNYDMFTQDTVNQMVDNAVVSGDPMVVIADSLESLSVVQDQGFKSIQQDDKQIIDMSMFCKREEDSKLVTYAYNSLTSMKNATDEEVCAAYDDYYKYLNNEEDSNFPIIYNEADKGVNYLLNQSYGGVFGAYAAEHGYDQSKLKYVEENTGMNDFSSVIREMQNCLDKNNSMVEAVETMIK